MNIQLLEILLASGFLLGVLIVIFLVRQRGWPKWTSFDQKTLWDFMQLLIIPFAASSIAFVYSTYQEQIQKIIETNRTNDQILQSYFNDVSDLMLNYDLRSSDASDKDQTAQKIVRARTVATLGVLDGKRNGILLTFLSKAELISLLKDERLNIDLQGAVLRDCQLNGISLNDSNFQSAVLVRVKLQ